MKWYTMIATTVLLLVLVGCGGNMYNTSDKEDNNSVTEDDNTKDDISNNSEDNDEDTETNTSNNDISSEDNQAEDVVDNLDSDNANEDVTDSDITIDEQGTTKAQSIEDWSAIEYTEPEDTTTYDTGLVFVKQEGDLWRVVDRMGNVYRVSTSYTPIAPGTIADVAHVSENEEGDVGVELEYGFTQHKDAVVLEGNPDKIPREFVTDLLEQTTSIEDYRIRDVAVTTRGKGMLIVTMKYDVKPKNVDGEWPSVDESNYTQLMKYQFVVYGYDTTWVIPTYPSLLDGSVLDDGHDTAVNRNGNKTSSNQSQQGSGANTTSTSGKQIDIYKTGKNHYYYVQEKEKQSQQLQGTNVYEYTSIIYSEKDGKRLPLTSGMKNTDYNVLKIQDGYIYLMQEGWEPNSESFPSGIGVIDIADNSYNRMYQGPVKEAATTSQNIYLFGTDSLLAIDVADNRLVTVADLPESLNFRMHNINVVGIQNNVMEISAEANRGTKSYAINLGTGDIIDLN